MDAVACDRVMDSGVAVLRDESKEYFAPRIIEVMENLIAKFLQLFGTDGSNGFRDGFAPLFGDALDVDLIEWHKVGCYST